MTWTFDTGRTSTQRNEVMTKVIAALQSLRAFDANGDAVADGFLQAVLPFGGIVRSYTDEPGIDQLWTLLQGYSPAIAVGLGEKRYRTAGQNGPAKPKHIGDLEVIVYILNRNNASLLARVEGDGQTATDVGLWHCLERIEEKLVGLEITLATLAPGSVTPSNTTYTVKAGKDVKHLIPRLEEELATTNELTLWKQTYAVEVARSISADRALSSRLKSVATTVKTTDEVPGTIAEITTLIEEEEEP